MELRQLLSTVTGSVFNDFYRDGLRGDSEVGLSGRTVYADYNYNRSLDAGEPRAITNAVGIYSLEVRPEQVDLRVVINPGEEITLGYGATNIWLPQVSGLVTGNNFPIALPLPTNPVVSGTVFLDSNGNGLFDAGETPLAGRVVYGDLNNDGTYQTWPVEPVTTTNLDGSYTINVSQRPYNVTLRVLLESGEVSSGLFVSNAGQGASGQNIPVRIVSSVVSGRIFADSNRNRQVDPGEAGLAARTVYADYNYNGMFDAGEPSTLTDANGHYALATRSQYVQLSLVLNPGEETTLGYGANSIWIPLVNGATSGVNIGIASASPTNQVTGRVYFDSNRNGTYDTGEPGQPNRTVFADYNYNGVLDAGEPRAITDANGNYVLPTRAQHVDLRMVLNPNEVLTLGYGAQNIWIPTVNGTVSGKNFSIAGGYGIRFRYFADYNLDGVWNHENETALPNDHGVFAFIDSNANDRYDAGEIISELTGTQYGVDAVWLRGVPPGTYRVVLGNYLPSGQFVVGGSARMITIPYGPYNDDYYFVPVGGYTKSHVDVYIYIDTNGNGRKDPNESNLEDSTIYADYNMNGQLDEGEPSATDVSFNPLGSTSLDLPTQNVAIRFILPAGYRVNLPGGLDYLWVELTTPTRRGIYVTATPIV